MPQSAGNQQHMKLKKSIITAILALAGIGWGIKPASAATLNYNAGDVLVGFYATGGTGSSSTYVINLGSINTYLNASGSIDLSYLGNIGADLTAVYGSDWSTRADLYWGIAAATGTAVASQAIVYGSHSRSELGVVSEGWNPITNNNVRNGGVRANINSWGGTVNNVTSTANSNYATIGSTDTASSFSKQLSYGSAFPYGQAFSDASGWLADDFLGNFGNGVDGATLDFFRVGANTVNTYYVGTFGLSEAGQLSFNVVPEPSTYALLIVVGVGFLAFRRRQRVAIKA